MANVSLSDDRLVSVDGDNANVDDGDGAAAADDDDGGVDNNVHDVDDANNVDDGDNSTIKVWPPSPPPLLPSC